MDMAHRRRIGNLLIIDITRWPGLTRAPRNARVWTNGGHTPTMFSLSGVRRFEIGYAERAPRSEFRIVGHGKTKYMLWRYGLCPLADVSICICDLAWLLVHQ